MAAVTTLADSTNRKDVNHFKFFGVYYREKKIWHHFTDDVIAENALDAHNLTQWVTQQHYSLQYLQPLEIVDLQNYRLIKQRSKIQDVLRLPAAEQVFLFVVNKN